MNINLLFFVTLIIAITLAILYYNLLKEHRKLKKFASVFTMRDWHKKKGTEEEYNKLFEMGVKEVNDKLEEAENNEKINN
ncbi:MAG: hypothetical protein CMC63_08540 [Flavobacteriaceae bacterium]|nr:hypothetical protein [Flavobacteriaceae bacterium]|tara:strand:- start:1674 stop:1913 length:240 start_codon:yes stop_codon:yes gene_type:complete